jgi:hypothetical protein
MKDAVTGLGNSVCEKRYYDFTTNQIESNLKIPDQHATMPLTENRGYKNGMGHLAKRLINGRGGTAL